MSLKIKIENFEGPFDLLLHLIRKNKMDIYDVKIYEITNQYLKYIESMKEMDLEVTSEFIVIAATLLYIKSSMLLPKSFNEEEEDETDPKEELIKRLIEYNKFKNVSHFLATKESEVGVRFFKKAEIIEIEEEPTIEDLLKKVSILDLFLIYNDIISRFSEKINDNNVIQKEIPMDRYKIEDKMEELQEAVKENKRMNFTEIMNNCEYKIEIVVTFMAMLELIKTRTIKVLQDKNYQDIYIEGVLTDE
ncbi:segregation/condensation protein A [Clostridium grantii]|uniref:Segregation and condensation protein A n=1 Tax=Clostridium grantii DSM 8605 TaxID=1121316 RepID=A0A1M5SB84_9CLOT|nr:segregation/condensation protein A [Clostridium grantii]SHH35548.1 condensin subunit ScpA [Clostridium grantii DSM 8605]